MSGSVSYSVMQGGEYINPDTGSIVKVTGFHLGTVYCQDIDIFSQEMKMPVEKFLLHHQEFVVPSYP